MKKFLIFGGMLVCFLGSLSAQIKIPNTTVSFQFPNQHWKYYETIKEADNTMVYLYAYNDSEEGTEENTCNPILRIAQKPNTEDGAIQFSLAQFIKSPSVVLETIQDADYFPNDNSVAYVAEFTDSNNDAFKLFILDFVQKKQAIEFKFIAPESCYEDFTDDFITIIKSINLKSK